MAAHFGHVKNDSVANDTGNTRNGKSHETLKGKFGYAPIDILCDIGTVRTRAVSLALIEISKKWTMLIRDWKTALNQFTIQFKDRMLQQ